MATMEIDIDTCDVIQSKLANDIHQGFGAKWAAANTREWAIAKFPRLSRRVINQLIREGVIEYTRQNS